jgi:hypothetical protein
MLHIHRCVDESIVIGDEIRVFAVEISETEVRLALTGVDDRRLDFAIERPAAEHSSGGHVRVRTTR